MEFHSVLRSIDMYLHACVSWVKGGVVLFFFSGGFGEKKS